MGKTEKSSQASRSGGRTLTSLTAVVTVGGSPTPWSPQVLESASAPSPLPMQLSFQEPAISRSEAAQSGSASDAPISPDEPFEQYAARCPVQVARVLQALLSEDTDAATGDGIRKAATLIIGLGSQLAPAVLKQCNSDELDRIAQAVRSLKAVRASEVKQVFDEARENLISGNYNLEGGFRLARTLLYSTKGNPEARSAVERLLETDPDEEGIRMLNEMEPDRIVPFIVKEHPQTIALIMSQTDPKWAAEALSHFPEELRSEVLDRIGELDTISAGVLYGLQSSIAWELSALLSGRVRKVGGPEIAASIISHLVSNEARPRHDDQDVKPTPQEKP